MSHSTPSRMPRIDFISWRVKTTGSLFGLFARMTPST
jgi:hypothetical protein